MTQQPLTLYLAAPRGFCAGVDRAIKIVEMALEKWGAPVYVRHEIVHNKFVVDGLRAKGAVFVEELDECPRRPPGDLFRPWRAQGRSGRGRAARDDLCRRDLPAGHQGPYRGRSATPRTACRCHDRPCRPPRDHRHDGPVAPGRRCCWSKRSRMSPASTCAIRASWPSSRRRRCRSMTRRNRRRAPGAVSGHHRPAQGRHLLRHHQPAGGGQGDGAAMRRDAGGGRAEFVELAAAGRGGRARRLRLCPAGAARRPISTGARWRASAASASPPAPRPPKCWSTR